MLNQYLTRNTASSSHSSGIQGISPNQLLSTGNGFTPTNPGDLREIRTVKVEKAYRPATKQDVQQARVGAAKAQAQAKRDEQYYRALAKHEVADARSQQAYRTYQGVQAGATYKKTTANANYGKRLVGLAPQYAKTAFSLNSAGEEAATRFTELQYQYNQRR